MDSIEELETRIVELSTAIDAQLIALTHLQTLRPLRSKAQHELNAKRDPMARLPLEISGQIFKYCAHTVSHRRHPPFAEFCENWVERARSLPLTLSLQGSVDVPLREVVNRYATRLVSLDLRLPDVEVLTKFPGPFSALKTLKVHAMDLELDDAFVSIESSMRILRAAPELSECHFDNIYYSEEIDEEQDFPLAKRLIHASLQRLYLGKVITNGKNGKNSYNSSFILPYLTLPALESLHVSDIDIPIESMTSFLARSSASLQSLAMRRLNISAPLSSLVTMVLSNYGLGDSPIFDALHKETSILPNLQNLSIQGRVMEPEHYETLLDMLALRRESRTNPLQSFHLSLTHVCMDPDEDATLRFHQLAADGMLVRVTPKRRDFMAS
ncbi:F-box domain-containing protein [Favolaschia claudopus]|uniref:F-box domain-containing protein n=1 Tax=Favolaschia claudopus TaxID=2862362 RepID=A0AAW0B873_9AGAR